MTEQPIVNDEALQQDHRQSVLTKLDVAWGSNVGDQGFADPYEVAARAYDALYRPDQVAEGMDARAQATKPDIATEDLPSNKLRSATREALTAPIELDGQVPSEEEFVATVAQAILHEADVASTVLPGAREQIQQLTENGDRPAIWSAGHPEHQQRKLGKTGLFNTVEIEGIEPPVEVTAEHGEPLEVPVVVAANKTTAETFDRVREVAHSDQIVVVDDRVKNLNSFLEGVPETKVAIWVQYGAHAQKEMDKLAAGNNPQLAAAIESGIIVPIASIDQLASKIIELRQAGTLTEEQAAIFLDYDDTIGDNARRRDLELAAAVDIIFERGWA
jgi:hypothetical protein